MAKNTSAVKIIEDKAEETKTDAVVVNPNQALIDHITANKAKMSTSAVIRYVAAALKADDDDFAKVNNKTYNFIKNSLPFVTTKSGGEIRYQHVRGVMSQILTGKTAE